MVYIVLSQRLSDRISALPDFAEAQKLQILPFKEFQIGFIIIFKMHRSFLKNLNLYSLSNDIIGFSVDSFTEALGSSVAKTTVGGGTQGALATRLASLFPGMELPQAHQS